MTVAVMVAGLLVFRLVVGTGDSRGFSTEQITVWSPLTAVVLTALIGLGWRLDVLRRRRSRDGCRSPRELTETARHLRRTAARLADTGVSRSAEAQADWAGRLARLEKTGIASETIAQARGMSPEAWLAWTFYDGEIDVSDVLPKS